MLLDMLFAGIAIGIASFIAVSAMVAVHRSRQRADRLQFAAQVLNNQLERVSSLKWDELTPEALKNISLSETSRQHLPDARLKLSVVEVTQPQNAKKLSAQLIWPDRDQTIYPPLRLTTWVFDQREAR